MAEGGARPKMTQQAKGRQSVDQNVVIYEVAKSKLYPEMEKLMSFDHFRFVDVQRLSDTTELLEKLAEKTADIVIIFVGIKEIKRHREAIANMEKIAELVDQEKTIVVQIPPIQSVADESDLRARSLFNQKIAVKFNHVVQCEGGIHRKYSELLDMDNQSDVECQMLVRSTIRKLEQIVRPNTFLETTDQTEGNKTHFIVIPSNLVGHVIGKQGKTLQRIEKTHKCELKIKRSNFMDGYQYAKIVAGTDRCVKATVKDIYEIICHQMERQRKEEQEPLDIVFAKDDNTDQVVPQQDSSKTENSKILKVPEDQVKHIIGAQGWKINELKETNNVEITIDPDISDVLNSMCNVTISGSKKCIAGAVTDIEKILNAQIKREIKEEKLKKVIKHENSREVCKRFLKGKCMNGDTCPRLH